MIHMRQKIQLCLRNGRWKIIYRNKVLTSCFSESMATWDGGLLRWFPVTDFVPGPFLNLIPTVNKHFILYPSTGYVIKIVHSFRKARCDGPGRFDLENVKSIALFLKKIYFMSVGVSPEPILFQLIQVVIPFLKLSDDQVFEQCPSQSWIQQVFSLTQTKQVGDQSGIIEI